MSFQVKALCVAIALISSNGFAASKCNDFGALNREEIRKCTENLPVASVSTYTCVLQSGRDILKMVEVKATERNQAIMRATIENAVVDGDSISLKEQDLNTTKGAWTQVVTNVVCILPKK
jgi:hypothetical protein